MDTLLIVVFAALSLMSVGVLKSYRHVSERELKRRAREGDELAAALYRAVAYGSSLNAVLWFMVVVSNALFFVWIAKDSPTWFAVVATSALIWFAFVWLPARDVTRLSTWVAIKLAPPLAWLLHYLHPVFSRIGEFIDRHKPISVHTGLYDREDLVNLIHDQKVQPGNRIDQVSLDIALHTLTFGDKLVRDVMVPRRVVKMVAADETVGPVLMSELHKSGFSRFPVYSGKKDNVVGMLFLRDLIKAKAGGSIEKTMKSDVMFVHEEQPLTDALQAILKTRNHQFIVVNGFEEYVGIITMEDVLEQVIGKAIIDEFDQYDDVRAVAARNARKEHTDHVAAQKKAEKPVPDAPTVEKPTEEPPEVVK